jgi:hypothetical protein
MQPSAMCERLLGQGPLVTERADGASESGAIWRRGWHGLNRPAPTPLSTETMSIRVSATHKEARMRRKYEHRLRVATAGAAMVLAIVPLAACGSSGPKVIPDVRNMPLDSAIGVLKTAGVGYSYNQNQGMFGILRQSDWMVCGENPPAGTTTTQSVYLVVRHWSC